jgi:hypothetical protein
VKYHKWLPYPKAWGQAIVMMIDLIPLGIFQLIFGKIIIRILSTGAESSSKTGDVLPLIILITIIILIEIYIFAITHQILWYESSKNLPKWLPNLKCWQAGFIGFFVSIMAISCGLFFTEGYFYDQDLYYISDRELYTVSSISTFVFSAYIFHLGNLIFKKYQKEEAKPERKVDPIEQELNGIKGKLGINKMNDVNKYD